MSTLPNADPISTSGWILVIVRDQRLHHLFLLALSQAGYTVLGSMTISEAEPILREHAPPGSSSWTARRQVRKRCSSRCSNSAPSSFRRRPLPCWFSPKRPHHHGWSTSQA